MPLNIDKKLTFIEYLGSNKSIAALDGYNNIKQIIAIDSSGLNPISWTSGEPDDLQGFLSLETFQGYLIESKTNVTFPYTLYSENNASQSEKLITKKFQIARYVGNTLNIASSSLIDKVKVIYKIDKVNGDSVPKTWTPGEDDSLQGFTTLENNEVYFIDSQQGSLPYVFWSVSTPTPTGVIKTIIASNDSGMGLDTPSGLLEYYGEDTGIYYQSPYKDSKLEYTQYANTNTTIVFASILYNGQYFGNVSFQKGNIGYSFKIYANCKVYSGIWTEGSINLSLIGNDPACSTRIIVASIDSGMGNDTPSGQAEYYGEAPGVYYQSPHQNSKLEYLERSGGDTTVVFASIKYDGQYFGNVSFQKKYTSESLKVYVDCTVYNAFWQEGTINLSLYGDDPNCSPTPTPTVNTRIVTASIESGMGNETPSGNPEYYGEAPGVYYQSPNQNSKLEYSEYSGGDVTITFASIIYNGVNVRYLGNVSFQKKYIGSNLKIYANCKLYSGIWSENTINLSLVSKDPSCPPISCGFIECGGTAGYADCGLINQPGYVYQMNCEVCECIKTAVPTPTPTPMLATPTPTPTPTLNLPTVELAANTQVDFGVNTPSGGVEYYGEAPGIYFQTPNQGSKLVYKNLWNIGGGTQILFSILNLNSTYFANVSFQAKYVGQEFKVIHNCKIYSGVWSTNSVTNLSLLGQDPNCGNKF